MKGKKWRVIASSLAGLLILGYFQAPNFFKTDFEQNLPVNLLPPAPAIVPKKPIHLPTPKPLKGLYLTSYAAATPSLRAHVLGLLDRTEANAVIIDIKDYRGRIAFLVNDPELKKYGSEQNLIRDIDNLIAILHEKGIYVIGRISVFQDVFLVNQKPHLAVKTKSGLVWRDRKGIGFLDPASREVWDYVIAIGREAWARGFDELNFDYIRFPTDGNMKDIAFPISDNRPKAEVIEEFFAYLHENLKDTGAILSADLFGMVLTNTDDLNIGQVLERAVPYFDYICPMVYPSHYPPGWNGHKNPASVPYEVISFALQKGKSRLLAIGEDPAKIRPWLQDFNLGAIYTAEMVRKQIQATYDSGLDSWMLWDPANKYTEAALMKAN